jgi:hypothetical protein
MSELKLIHTQLGYRPGHSRKRILAPDTPEANGIFGDPTYWVADQRRFSQHPPNADAHHASVHQGRFQREGGDFGTWLAGDVSCLREPAVYQAYCKDALGPTFVLHEEVWCRVLPDCIRYMRVQSCGREAVGYHDACHLDDGYLQAEDRYLEAAGGWHDAGDFRKHYTSTCMNAYALLIAHRIWAGREQRLGLPAGVFLAEALQGLGCFLNLQDPATGMLYRACGDGPNLENRYTDNVRQSGDERLVDARPARPAGKCTTLFALYAEALSPRDADLAARCVQAAERSLRYDLSRAEQTADALQWRCWGHLGLWRATQDDQYRQAAVEAMNALLGLQVTDYVGGQRVARGFFRSGRLDGGYHHKHVGASYPIWVLAEFCDAWADHADAGRWRDAMALWVDGFARVFAERNPFGLLPQTLVDRPPADAGRNRYRPLGDGLFYRYFLKARAMGYNAGHCLNAVALAAAARTLDRPALMDDAYRLLEWVVGANPFQLSTVSGVGVRQATAHSLQVGDIPGGVMNGVGGDEEDMPYFGGHPWLCNAAYSEYYGYNTAHFLWAIAALQDLRWDS